MLAQCTQRVPSMWSPRLAWPERGVRRWTSGDKVGCYTNYHLRPSCRYTGTLKGWPGNGGSTGGKRAHQNPVVFTVDGGDSTVDGGLDWLYSCRGSTWMWDNDLRKVLAMRRTREGAHQHETAVVARSGLELMVVGLKLRILGQKKRTKEVIPWMHELGRWAKAAFWAGPISNCRI
jgi:hypothetical protein